MTAQATLSTPGSSGAHGLTHAEVDTSFRLVAVCAVAKSALWLLAGSFLLLLASVKLHAPGMMSGTSWLAYGRLAPAGWSALVYGFAGQLGPAIALWILARASMQRLQHPLLVLAGGCVWNLGVLAGTVGILAGYSTGREWLEMPAGAMGCLVMGAGLIGVCGWLTFAARTEPRTYAGTWFVLLALLSFVWFGTVALMMLASDGPRGVLQVLVQRWFANGAQHVWLGGIAAAILFHQLPKVFQRPLASRQLALIGFWCLAFFTPWSITEHGDPFPRWIVSAGLAGQFLGAIGLFAIALNWWKTGEGALATAWRRPDSRLILVSAASYLLAGFFDLVFSFQSMSARVRFTWIAPGLEWLLTGGAVILALFALVPEFLARAAGRTLSPSLSTLHRTLSLFGIILIALPLILGGLFQGSKLADPTVPFLDALRFSMHLVRLSSLGFLVFMAGQLVYATALAGVAREMILEAIAMLRSWSIPASGKNRPAGARS